MSFSHRCRVVSGRNFVYAIFVFFWKFVLFIDEGTALKHDYLAIFAMHGLAFQGG